MVYIKLKEQIIIINNHIGFLMLHRTSILYVILCSTPMDISLFLSCYSLFSYFNGIDTNTSTQWCITSYMMSSCNATLSLEQTRMWIVCWYDWFSHYTYNMSQTTVICCTVFSFGDSRMLWCIILYVSPTTNYHSPTQRFPFSPICKHWNHANSLLHTNIPNHQFDRIIQQPNI